MQRDAADTIAMPAARRLRLRRADRCVICARELAAGELGVWDPSHRTVRCLVCDGRGTASPLPEPESRAGGSARREYDRRRERREARVRDRLGPLAGVALALSPEPADQRAWARGADGEVKLAAKLHR